MGIYTDNILFLDDILFQYHFLSQKFKQNIEIVLFRVMAGINK